MFYTFLLIIKYGSVMKKEEHLSRFYADYTKFPKERGEDTPPQIPPPPHLAFPPKPAIINIRWKLKSRRDLRVLQHPQARAGEIAPTRNSPAVHDDILIIQCRPFPHKRSACAAGEVTVIR